MNEISGAVDFQRETGASASIMAEMTAYLDLITEWRERMNLVGPSALDTFWGRHAFDSAQLLEHAPGARVWADIGAGAGFPGVVLAIFLKGQPGAKIHLVESLAKRCVFLRAVADALHLPVEVHNQRAENVAIKGVEVVTARAVAPLPKLLGFAHGLLKNQGTTQPIGLFLKGASLDEELTEARRMWDFQSERIQSRSDPTGCILRVERLRRARS